MTLYFFFHFLKNILYIEGFIIKIIEIIIKFSLCDEPTIVTDMLDRHVPIRHGGLDGYYVALSSRHYWPT